LIEVNARFGDPETQVLLPRLRSDLAELLDACVEGTLGSQRVEWSDEACVSVVVASGGYPDAYETGKEITLPDDALIFHAGTAMRDGNLVSAGGRVLNVTALGASIPEARSRVYDMIGKVKMDGMYARSDIAKDIT
jgi:phosphoribosylamine--glycine ligase